MLQSLAWIRAIVFGRRVDADLAEEIRFHIERETQANVARGMSADAARRAARLTFGSVDAAQETSRDERPGALMREIVRDVHFGARLLRKSPVIGITGVALVALGIGAATAIFSVVYGVMLRPLPFREPEQLVSIWLERHSARNYPTAADAVALRGMPNAFADVALLRKVNLNLVGACTDGACEPQRLEGARVEANFFSVLGVSAVLGRTFTTEEAQPGRDKVVVLSNALWRGRFDADPAIVGRQIHLDGSLYTVVGVMGSDFRYPSGELQAWVPLVVRPAELTRSETENYSVIARLAPSVTLAGAREASTALAKRLADTYGVNVGVGFIVESMLADAIRDVRPVLTLLLAAVSLLLAIACVNLSSLFGARARARRGELAVRLALGATRTRLIAQAIAEAIPILALGGTLGVASASWAVRLFVVSAPAGMPRLHNIGISAPVSAVSLLLLVLTGLAASVAPAMQAWRSDFTSMTRDGGRSSTEGRGKSMARRVAVAVQIAFAIPLLVGASLLIRSAVNLMNVDAGFRAARVTTLKFEVLRARHSSDREVADYYARLIEAVKAIPGVASVGLVNRIPLSGGQTNPIHVEHSTARPDELTNVDTRTVSPDYFATMGIALVAGRGFTEQDDSGAPLVAVVDERLARAMWPGESAIGKSLREPPWSGRREIRVIGVVRHVRAIGLDVDPLPQVYWSYWQWTQNRMVLAVRSATQADVPAASVIRAIQSVDAEQSVYDVHTMSQIVDESVSSRRLAMNLMVAFSALALVLAAVGIYGVVAYGVTQRMREFGIRVALGATGSDIVRLASWQGTSAALVGAGAGLVLAVGASGAMSNLVFGIEPRDGVSIVVAMGVLLLVAVVASYIPARQAAAVDPGITLRSE
ncbi:MAG TPA: ABC transporter permease [Gemmatimonadaceae bacterium]|nr:ABC transporter permease [Gemmatimonadaceae bacterium]